MIAVAWYYPFMTQPARPTSVALTQADLEAFASIASNLDPELKSQICRALRKHALEWLEDVRSPPDKMEHQTENQYREWLAWRETWGSSMVEALRQVADAMMPPNLDKPPPSPEMRRLSALIHELQNTPID
jgi:hypothetical protein